MFPGPFSASSVPADSFLTLRPIWPRRKPAEYALKTLLDTNEFFSEREVRSAKHILDNGKLGLDQFEALLELLVPDPRRTPRQRNGSFGSYLGPFSHLGAPKTNRFLDPGQHQLEDDESPLKRFQSLSNRGVRYRIACDEIDNEGMGNEDETKDDDNSSENGDTGNLLPTLQMQSLTVSESSPPAIKWRTPDETTVVGFLVQIISALALQIQPVQRLPVCVANAQEETFNFGPITSTIPQGAAAAGKRRMAPNLEEDGQELAQQKGKKTVSQQPAQPAIFHARIDGGIPTCLRDGVGLIAIFEAKRSRRDDNDVEVRVQQTMEHVALIWERHTRPESQVSAEASSTSTSTSTNTIKQQRYHTLMITQDATDIYVNFSTYCNAYLDYLFERGSTKVVPSDLDADVTPYLFIQELGPFDVNSKRDLRLFIEVVLVLLVRQLDSSVYAGSLIRGALRDISGDSDKDEHPR
ncbi:hypothetical protein B0T16DRAFT_463244 [Cercophora newfieldiana]|uniref:Uncharacterized protein n=1 Tax=Cercophora newfieldiana TaxID=92897 RepID=A0AA39XST1_9PEZI|nr:hypothetical protein B0T16DRAFT_463244 [Cercophora newfieldiana]